jgi:hypothetical protein
MISLGDVRNEKAEGERDLALIETTAKNGAEVQPM